MAELASPISGGINSARGVMSSGPSRTEVEDRIAITNLIGGLSVRLDRITRDLADTTNIVEKIRATIDENTFLDRQKEAIEQERQRRLAEQQLREGQESLIEQKIESAAVVPAQKAAARAQFSLNNLMGLFTTLLGGWLTVKVFSNFQNIQKFTLEKLRNTKDFIQGVFANIGNLFKGFGSNFLNLFTGIGRIENILKNSFNNDLFKGGFGVIKDIFEKAYNTLINFDPSKLNPFKLLDGAGGGGPPLPGEQNRPGGVDSGLTSALTNNTNLSFTSNPLINNLFGGFSGMNPESFLGEGSSKLNNEYGFNGVKDYGLGMMGSGAFTLDMFKNLYDISSQDAMGGSTTNTTGPIPLQVIPLGGSGGTAPAIRAESIGPAPKPETSVVVSAASATTPTIVPPSLNRNGNNIPNISSSNPDNFYVLYSMANYNVVI